MLKKKGYTKMYRVKKRGEKEYRFYSREQYFKRMEIYGEKFVEVECLGWFRVAEPEKTMIRLKEKNGNKTGT